MKKTKNKKGKIPTFSGISYALRDHAETVSAGLPHLQIQAEKAVASIIQGEHRQRKPGAGERFWQFREYNPSDRPQDIDWRQSGKTDKVFIRQKEWQTNQTCFLWCAKTPGMDFHSDVKISKKEEAAKIITLALALLLNHAGEEIGLLQNLTRGRSENTLQTIGNYLVDKKETTKNLPEPMAVPRHSKLILTGDFVEPLETIENNFKALASQSDSGLVVQILDPAEIELPYDGRVIFEDPSSSHHHNINNVGAIRSEYQNKIQSHIRNIEALCHACEWHYVLHRTDGDIRDSLLKIWTSLSLHKEIARR